MKQMAEDIPETSPGMMEKWNTFQYTMFKHLRSRLHIACSHIWVLMLVNVACYETGTWLSEVMFQTACMESLPHLIHYIFRMADCSPGLFSPVLWSSLHSGACLSSTKYLMILILFYASGDIAFVHFDCSNCYCTLVSRFNANLSDYLVFCISKR